MQNIQDIRRALLEIPEAIYEFEPEMASRGDHPAKRVWDGSGEGDQEHSSLVEAEEDGGEAPQFEGLFEIPPEIDMEEIEEMVSGDRGRDLYRSIMDVKGDGWAWYLPFHAKGLQWGIYIPVSSIVTLAHFVFGSVRAPFWVRCLMVIRSLHQHELFHFAAEYMCAQMEIIHGVAVYKPSRRLKKVHGYNPLEEKIANASMIRSLWGRGHQGKTRAIRQFVLAMEAGYNEGGSITREELYRADCAQLVRRYAGCVPAGAGISSRVFDADRLFPVLPADWRFCPIHVVSDEDRLALPPILLDFFGRIAGIFESDKFLRMLRKQPETIQQRWSRLKFRLEMTTAANAMDFKPWPKAKHAEGRVFSVRVSGGHRAHLLFKKATRMWEALEIGDHKAMGHG